MDATLAREYLDRGLWEIERKAPDWQREEDYYRGKQDLPYAPEGVNQEYLDLREMALANWLKLAMNTPIQRLRVEGFRTGRRGDADETTWNEVWQPNKLDSRQRIPLTEMVVHGRGLMSVWPNPRPADRKTPKIAVESSRRVHLEPSEDDPWTTAWAVKTFPVAPRKRLSSALILPPGAELSLVGDYGPRQVGMVYDDTHWARFERETTPGTLTTGPWVLVTLREHTMGEVPFVPFDNDPDADGVPHSAIRPLMPAQDAINTIRFLTLLAMQFSGYRQRVFTGYDPVVRDATGEIVYRRGGDGQYLLDNQGQKIPVVASPGRVGVDRALVFPGADTKVFDMPESNLDNYIKVLGEFLTDLFAVGQVPPQYLLNRMANLSGDALAGAESTLKSYVADLQRSCGESYEAVMRLGNRARGEDYDDAGSEAIWADSEAKSFAQLVDGITKLVSTAGFPVQGGFEMLPGATPQKVRRWMELARQEAQQKLALDPVLAGADLFRAPPPSDSAPSADDDAGVTLPDDTPTAPGLPRSRTPAAATS